MYKKKNLILLTYEFPYGKSEPFLETEVNYFQDFDKVNIFSLAVKRNSKKRDVANEKIEVYPIYFASPLIYTFSLLRALVDINFYKELISLIKNKRLNLKRLKRLLIFVLRSRYEASQIKKIMKRNFSVEESGIIYSYRLSYQAYVALLLKKSFPNFKVVARAHGSDLYEYSNDDNYIPLRETVIPNMNEIVCISKHGEKYLEGYYQNLNKNIMISKLGTLDFGEKRIENKNGVLNIVSCSAVVKLKRIDKIIDSLSKINDIQINWTHYGDGILFHEMVEIANNKLPSNINAEFRGFVSNQQILQEYREKEYHIFINVSESEGIPVSIMEATSFGIPVIATDVGGTSEIVIDNYNGFLLEKDFNNNDLKDLIVKLDKMSFEEYYKYRINARKYWEGNYDANTNYKKFIKYLFESYN